MINFQNGTLLPANAEEGVLTKAEEWLTKVFGMARRRGPRIAIIAVLTSAITFVASQIMEGILSGVKPYFAKVISESIWPPFVTIQLSEVNQSREDQIFVRNPLSYENIIPKKIVKVGEREINILISPGNYQIWLEKDVDKDVWAFAENIFFERSGDKIKLNNSLDRWFYARSRGQTDMYFEPLRAAPSWVSPRLPRDYTLLEDFQMLGAGLDATLRATAFLALSQVGLGQDQGRGGPMRTINRYWERTSPTPVTAEVQRFWQAAFLSWVVQSVGERPPRDPARNYSWTNWGRGVDFEAGEIVFPGMIVIYRNDTRPIEEPGALFIGIFLKKRENCWEFVAGASPDRVAIICSPRRPYLVRTFANQGPLYRPN